MTIAGKCCESGAGRRRGRDREALAVEDHRAGLARSAELVELLVGDTAQPLLILRGEAVGLVAHALAAAGVGGGDERLGGGAGQQDDDERADDHLDHREPAIGGGQPPRPPELALSHARRCGEDTHGNHWI